MKPITEHLLSAATHHTISTTCQENKMRIISANSLTLDEFHDESMIPPYAISHTDGKTKK